MVQTNLKIIAELKSVLNEISENQSLRELVTNSPTAFSRDRKLTMQRLVGLIINLPKRSLSIEIQEFFRVLEVEDCATKGAFCQQRSKLLPIFFQIWNNWLIDCFYKYYGDNIKRWKGFRLLAVDGSMFYLLNKKEVADYFGGHKNQHYPVPMARVMQTYDVLNNMIVRSNIYPLKISEQAIATNEVEELFEDSLSLYDRAFPSFEHIFLMLNQERPRHFVMRCQSDFNVEVSAFQRSNSKDKIIEIYAGKYAIKGLREKGFRVSKETAVKVRLVKVPLSSSETEILITNLYDKNEYSIKKLKELYGLRWGIETSYGCQKNQLQIEQFSGHRVICIQQDFAAAVFVHNLESLIEKQCEPFLKKVSAKRKYIYKVNKNVSIGSLKNNIVRLFLKHDPPEVLKILQQQFERNIEPVRPDRKYVRKRKTPRLNGKYQTWTNYRRAI